MYQASKLENKIAKTVIIVILSFFMTILTVSAVANASVSNTVVLSLLAGFMVTYTVFGLYIAKDV